MLLKLGTVEVCTPKVLLVFSVISLLCILYSNSGEPTSQYRTRQEQKQIPGDREQFTESDLSSLAELNPPTNMPNGNVGTTTKTFLEMIRQCKLPPLVIRKLGLTFPKQRSNRKYGDVHFDYGTVVHEGQSEPVVNVSGHELEPENPKLSSNEDCIGAKQTHLQDQTLAKLKGTKKKMSRIKGNLQKFDQEQRNSSSEEDEASEIEDRKSESVSRMFS